MLRKMLHTSNAVLVKHGQIVQRSVMHRLGSLGVKVGCLTLVDFYTQSLLVANSKEVLRLRIL